MTLRRGTRSSVEDSGIAALTANYRPLPGIYDEMIDATGALREHWQPLLDEFARLGPAELRHRFSLADQHLASAGVFYRVYEDRTSIARAYGLSHVPLLITAKDWAVISAGLSQRAELLEAILADAYGAGSLSAAGRLPAAMIAGSPEYLRPAHGIRPRGGRFLGFYAADIGRDAAGRWWVLRDRTQAPSGTGYALENRIALSRSLGELFMAYGVERLASFFDGVRSMLGHLREEGDAGICLLTPGPLNETYFEHAYLSRYLGFRLVEGQDLIVQGDRVYLRTVGGLRRVNVLLRRMDADFTDPLELNTGSRLGVAGLLSALRAGRVAVVNALGSGLMEAPAFLGFLPALGPHLLGERLAMPNVATWWCGQEAERSYVLENLDRLVVSPAFARAREVAPALPGFSNGDGGLDNLRQMIEARGVDFIGQEPVHLSTMPVWENGGLTPRPFVLRVYLAAGESGWQVMPGGMALVGERPGDRHITMQHGARTADVWLLSDTAGSGAAQRRPPETIEIRRATSALTSRAADNLYWFARYLERAEVTLRVVRALAARSIDLQRARPDAARLARMLHHWGAAGANQTAEQAVRTALFDRGQPGSVAALVASAATAGAVIRNRFPIDGWRALEDTRRGLEAAEHASSDALTIESFGNTLLRNFAAITGVELDNMNRLSGWRFLKLGARIERAILVSRLCRSLALDDGSPAALETLLELNGCEVTYRVRYPHGAALIPVLDLVLLDDSNPRSLAFALASVEDHIASFAHLRPRSGDVAGRDAIEDLRRRFAELELDTLAAPQLVAIENLLMQVSDAVTARYFDLSDSAHAAGEEQ